MEMMGQLGYQMMDGSHSNGAYLCFLLKVLASDTNQMCSSGRQIFGYRYAFYGVMQISKVPQLRNTPAG